MNKIKQRFDVDSGKTRERDITRPNLIKALRADGMRDPCGNHEKLQEICEKRNLPTKFTERVIKEGWIGKPKGALQVLFERGWINPSCIHKYTAKGRDDAEGYSIDELMKLQPDFASEQTLLQYHAKVLGVKLIRSPKCHPEIAGEGVEYGWGLSKMLYRRSPSSCKRNKDAFHKLVYQCVDNGSVLNIERMRKCSKKARDYMVLYKAVEKLNLDNVDGIEDGVVYNKHSILEGSIKLYRKLQKTKKRHRSVLDSQLYDLREMERECSKIDLGHDSKEHLVRCVVSKMITLVKSER